GKARHRRRGLLRRGRRAGPAGGDAPAGAGARHARPGAAHHVRPRLSPRVARARRGARAVPPVPGLVRGERPLMATETLTLGKALNEGLRRALDNDPKVVIMGEDVGKLGGVFRITDGLQKDFG